MIRKKDLLDKIIKLQNDSIKLKLEYSEMESRIKYLKDNYIPTYQFLNYLELTSINPKYKIGDKVEDGIIIDILLDISYIENNDKFFKENIKEIIWNLDKVSLFNEIKKIHFITKKVFIYRILTRNNEKMALTEAQIKKLKK